MRSVPFKTSWRISLAKLLEQAFNLLRQCGAIILSILKEASQLSYVASNFTFENTETFDQKIKSFINEALP